MSALGPIKGESCSAHLLPASFIEWTSALYRAYDPAHSCLQAGPHHALRREQGSFSTKIRLTWHSGASRILRLWLVRAHTIGLTLNTCTQFRVRGDRVGWIGNDETDMEDLTDDLQGMRCLFEIAPIRYAARPGYACKLTWPQLGRRANGRRRDGLLLHRVQRSHGCVRFLPIGAGL